MNTGHDGSLSTGHANSPKDMMTRLETMVLMGMEMPVTAIRSQISSAIDIVVHLARLRDKSRKVVQIAEGIVIVCVAAYIFYENILMAFILSPYVYLHYKQRKKERAKKDNNEFCRKFRDGIMSVSFALNVGYSIENAFIQAVEELELIYGRDSDITIKFRYIVVRLGQNENIEDIFMDFAEESKVEDIIYFAEIFRYAKRSGGDLISIIRNTTQIIQQKEEVLSEIDTIISGKRMEQRVMSIIPAAIVVYLKFTAAEFIQPLYGNMYGAVIMTVCLIVYVIADMWAKRIVNIEV